MTINFKSPDTSILSIVSGSIILFIGIIIVSFNSGGILFIIAGASILIAGIVKRNKRIEKDKRLSQEKNTQLMLKNLREKQLRAKEELRKKNEMWKEIYRKNSEIDRENRENFRKSQEAKGFKLYNNIWVTNSEYDRQIRMDNDLANRATFKGFYMKCNACGFIWKIKKDYGTPARCGKCNSDNINIDKEKSYSSR